VIVKLLTDRTPAAREAQLRRATAALAPGAG